MNISCASFDKYFICLHFYLNESGVYNGTLPQSMWVMSDM